MSEKAKDTREFVMELDLRHDPQTVWRALTDAQELTRWFPARAEVEPSLGGRVILDWDMEGCGFDTRIEIWEPNRRLRLVSSQDRDGQPTAIAIDFQITARNDGATLRLVHSGFGRGSDWDDELAAISSGWPYELRMLRRYLDGYRGMDRHMAMFSQATSLPDRTVFETVFGRRGLARKGNLFAIGEGGAYALTDVNGDVYRGEVLAYDPPVQWAGTVTGEDEGVLRFHVEGGAAMLGLALWGGDRARERVARFEREWVGKLAALVGASEA